MMKTAGDGIAARRLGVEELESAVEAPTDESTERLRFLRFENESRGRILELTRRVAELESTVARLEAENEHGRLALAELHRSFSWRVTRPLRGVRRALSRATDA